MDDMIQAYIDTLMQSNHDLVMAKSTIIKLNRENNKLKKEIKELKEKEEEIEEVKED